MNKIFFNGLILFFIIGGLSFTSCKKDSTSPELIIGQTYQGGVIAYILQPGDPSYNASVLHGLIAAPGDQSTVTGIQWYNGSSITVGDTATALGTGMANTKAIIAAQGTGNYAASLCRNLTLNGYSDWYLPSKNELNKLYLNHAIIGGFSSSNYYWSSTESNTDTDNAFAQFFYGGNQFTPNKWGLYYVRAVRSF